MKDIDSMIDEAISAEERELLREMRGEPGFIPQALGALGGRTGWVNLVLMLVQTALFFIGAWATWHFFWATEPVMQLRWGLPAAVLLIVATILKLSLVPVMQANRVLHALKRIELQLALVSHRNDRA